ncbi:hypothetical protein [uncultured Desulfuromusa sp.]|uniref:hypothetical protein n=1 Tax=uncultured Desulfuromusa sp. TaxID=219183 RepID=UPI002AA84C92|nr:hypothetical protein [uncultured Desulfuromusa sp.]
MKPHKYLQNRATLSPWKFEGTGRTDFSGAIVIPALAERASLPATVESLCLNFAAYLDRTLVIIVVNNRADIPADQLTENQETLDWLRSDPYPKLNLAWIDASSSGLELPAKEGVGLARKIGFDASLQLLDWKVDPLLISLDADTLVDRNYLATIFDYFALGKKGVAVIPFRHRVAPIPAQEQAIRHYELYLRSYLFGLQVAGSPYAYHSIGSAFACSAEAYVRGGGMNRRCGGEDFYFLQQLTKISDIKMLRGTVVYPSPRFSDRVPFGTGKAVQTQVEAGIDLFHFVPVLGFQILQRWLKLMHQYLDKSAEQIIQQALRISPVLYEFLVELNFVNVWKKLANNHSSPEQKMKAFHRWFDALRTRQLLMRIDADSMMSTQQNIAELMSWGGFPGLKDESDQLLTLEQLQGVDWT